MNLTLFFIDWNFWKKYHEATLMHCFFYCLADNIAEKWTVESTKVIFFNLIEYYR